MVMITTSNSINKTNKICYNHIFSCPNSPPHLKDFTCEPASQWKALNTTLAGGTQRPGAPRPALL